MARLCLIEDDEDLGLFLAALLRERGHEVTLVADGGRGLVTVLEGRFDLVLSDLGLPVLDGFSLIRAIRARFSAHDLPIVAISALHREHEIKRALLAGATDYLIKPISPGVLYGKLAVFLARRGSSEPAIAGGAPLAVGIDLRDYEVGSRIGSGGFSDVYRAVRKEDLHEVAIKLLRPTLASEPKHLRRFFREVEVLSSISSERIVRVHNAGYDANRLFLVMDRVRGDTVRRWLDDVGQLGRADVAWIGYELSRALAELHGRGVVHRDVKPDNVMLSEEAQVVLIDFGLAKPLDRMTLTGPMEIMGTLPYIAPEVVMEGQDGPSSDLFAVGVTLYELLTGELPYPDVAHQDLFERAAVGAEAPSVHELRPDLPIELAQLVDQLLLPNPEERPESADLVAERLLEHMDDDVRGARAA